MVASSVTGRNVDNAETRSYIEVEEIPEGVGDWRRQQKIDLSNGEI